MSDSGPVKPSGGIVGLPPYTIDLMDEMGRGTFGTVYRGHHDKTKAIVAVKKMQIKNEKMGIEGLEEIKKFEKIEAHRNIVRLYDFHYLDKSFWMIMEFCDLGDLEAYMDSHHLDMTSRLTLMYESACGLSHMHNQTPSIVHRDIKPGNILIKAEAGVPVVKLTDFGLSRLVDVEELMRTAIFSTVVGTPGFMAPELYQRLAYNFSVDTFALGLVFKAVIIHKKGEGLKPLSSCGPMMTIGQEMMMLAHQGKPIPSLLENEASDSDQLKAVKAVVCRMTEYDPKKRIHMKEVEARLKELCGGGTGGSKVSPEMGAVEPLHFHPTCDHNAKISKGGKKASKSKKNFCHGAVMSNRPLHPNEVFEVRLDAVGGSYLGGLGIGLTSKHPNKIKFAMTISDIKEDIWVMFGRVIYKNGEEVMDRYGGSDLHDLKKGDRVGIMRSTAGEMHVLVNGLDMGVAAKGLPEKVYAIVDIYGKANAISIVDQGGGESKETGYLFSRRRLPTPPPEYEMESSNDDSSDDDNADCGGLDDEDDDIGAMLLRQAIEEHLKGLIKKDLHLKAKEEQEEAMKKMSAINLLEIAGQLKKYKVGEKVRVDEDKEKSQRLQKGFGGWHDSMKKYLGKEGEVVSKTVMQVEVKFSDGQKWGYNPQLVHKLDEGIKPTGVRKLERRLSAMETFKNCDIVRIIPNKQRFEKLMKEAGLWRDWLSRVVGVTGIVHEVDKDGDVVVELATKERVWLHPDTLEHVDQTGMKVEAGDLVLVNGDIEEVKRNQEGFGGWHPDMEELVGHGTTVKRMVGEKAWLEGSEGRKWAFNVRSLRIIAKNNDLVQAAMAKKEAGESDSLDSLDDALNALDCKLQ